MSSYAKYSPYVIVTGSGPVTSVNGQVGAVVLTASDLFLGPSDNVTFGSVTANNLTPDTALIANSSKEIVSSVTTDTELSYVHGVTSSIQTQLNGKQATGNYITALTGDVTATGPGSAAATLATVNSNIGTFSYPTVTVNAKGLTTAVTTPTQSANTVFSGPSSGATAPPTFRSLVLADLPVSSGQSFITSGTTYTTPSNINTNTNFKFILIGGGGGSAGTNTVNQRGGGGGGGGGVTLYITGLTPSTAYTITIGSGGTAGANTPTAGGAGGNTTLTIGATTYTAGGGAGSTTGASQFSAGGGTATNGTINIPGQGGGCNSAAGTQAVSGVGGNSPWGWGLGGANLTIDNIFNVAFQGQGYGAGAGGAGGTGCAGAVGTQGCILVEWRA